MKLACKNNIDSILIALVIVKQCISIFERYKKILSIIFKILYTDNYLFKPLQDSAVTLKTSKEFPPNCSTQSYLPTRNSVDRPQNLKQLDCCPAAVSELNKFSTALSNPTATNNNQLQHLAASKAPNLLTCDNCRQNLNTSPNQNQQRLPNPSSTNSSCNHQISSESN